MFSPQNNEITHYGGKGKFYNVLQEISTQFAYARMEDYKDTIDNSLQLLGEVVKADRVYIFQYDFIENTCSNTFEYCRKGISREIDNLQNVPLEGIPDWVKAHKSGEVLYIPDVMKLLKTNGVREILEPQRVQSLITIPLNKDNELYGFLGFDSVLSKRKYTKHEQSLLKYFSNLLVSIIKRIELEAALEKQKQKVERIIEAAELGVWEWDISTDAVKFNKRWANILGYELDELLPHTLETWKRLTDPDDLTLAVKNIERLINGDTDAYIAEFKMRHKDGSVVWIKDTGKVIVREKGKPRVLLGAHIDITELKRQRQDLELIMKATEYSPASVVITDDKGNIQFVNQKFTDMTGYSEDEVLGKNPRILQSGEHDLNFYQSMWAQISKGQSWEGFFKNKKKNGQLYWESALIAPVQDAKNTITHYIAIKTDYTETKNHQVALNQQKIRLERDLGKKIEEVESSQKAAIIALAKLTESRDTETGKHVERVQYLCKALCASLGEEENYKDFIDKDFIDDIFFASALHDIGKISINDSILQKDSSFTPKEFEIMKNHVRVGSEILSEMARQNPKSKIIMGARIAKYHHERWDGNGYMEGLKGTQIPLEARIMSLVDVYDALRSKRYYKESYPHLDVVNMIDEQSGKQFDPDIVSAFKKVNKQFEVIYDSLL